MRIVWLCVVGCLGFASPVFAHAVLVESTPAISAQIPAGDTALRLRFNSRVDRSRSRLTLMRPGSAPQVVPIEPSGTDDVLIAHATLPPGAVILRWQVLAVDGHITRGDIPLDVTPAEKTPAEKTTAK